MTRREAVEIIYEVINSGIISEKLEEELTEICNCICDIGANSFEQCKWDKYINCCEGCFCYEDEKQMLK